MNTKIKQARNLAGTFILSLCLANTLHAESPKKDVSADRLISSPTAFSEGPSFDAGFHLHTFLGLAYSLGGSLRYTKKVGDKLHLGLGSNFGAIMAPVHAGLAVFGGAGPVFTYGDEDFLVNLSAMYYASDVGDQIGMLLPSLGISARVTDNVRFHAEVLFPLLRKFKNPNSTMLTYGFRVGRRIYFDISMVAPIGGALSGINSIFVLGIPVFGLGVGI